jgi:hypothetical protein
MRIISDKLEAKTGSCNSADEIRRYKVVETQTCSFSLGIY